MNLVLSTLNLVLGPVPPHMGGWVKRATEPLGLLEPNTSRGLLRQQKCLNKIVDVARQHCIDVAPFQFRARVFH